MVGGLIFCCGGGLAGIVVGFIWSLGGVRDGGGMGLGGGVVHFGMVGGWGGGSGFGVNLGGSWG